MKTAIILLFSVGLFTFSIMSTIVVANEEIINNNNHRQLKPSKQKTRITTTMTTITTNPKLRAGKKKVTVAQPFTATVAKPPTAAPTRQQLPQKPPVTIVDPPITTDEGDSGPQVINMAPSYFDTPAPTVSPSLSPSMFTTSMTKAPTVEEQTTVPETVPDTGGSSINRTTSPDSPPPPPTTTPAQNQLAVNKNAIDANPTILVTSVATEANTEGSSRVNTEATQSDQHQP